MIATSVPKSKERNLEMSTLRNKSIWIVIDSRGPGGIESHIAVLAVALREHGVNATVVFLKDHGAHPVRRMLVENETPVSIAGGVGGLLRLIKSEQPNLIHTHGYKAGILGRLFGALTRTPVVSTFHAGEPGDMKVRLYQLLDVITSRLSINIAVSEQINERLPGVSTLIDNFVDVPPPMMRNENAGDHIAFVGRLSFEKGADRFCDLARHHPAFTFDIYGDGPMRDDLERTSPDNVIFHGMQSDMPKIWPTVGLLCMPSRHEGLPLAALEAMARGIPVACFGVGGLPQLISDGKNGFCTAPNDTNALSDRLTQWRQKSKISRQQMCHAARETVILGYSTTAQLPKVMAVYANAIGDELSLESTARGGYAL